MELGRLSKVFHSIQKKKNDLGGKTCEDLTDITMLLDNYKHRHGQYKSNGDKARDEKTQVCIQELEKLMKYDTCRVSYRIWF